MKYLGISVNYGYYWINIEAYWSVLYVIELWPKDQN